MVWLEAKLQLSRGSYSFQAVVQKEGFQTAGLDFGLLHHTINGVA
jgi:hypothetical protein